jgi:hypothetical protein
MYLTETWRLKDQRYQLIGQVAQDTQELTFPPRPAAVREVPSYEFEAPAPDITEPEALALTEVA